MAIKATTDGVRVGEVVVLRKTDKSVLVAIKGTNHWVPFSQIHDDSEIFEASRVGEAGSLVITQWLADKIGVE